MSPKSPRSQVGSAIKAIAYSVAGIVLATVGLKGFLIPNHFIDGGVTGISMLVSEFSSIDLAVMLLVVNLPFVGLAALQISWRFAVRSALGILGLAISVHFLPIQALTHENVLSAVFGGISLGAGIGLAFRGGSVLDGTEILAILASNRLGFSIGDVILIFNACLFGISAYLLGIDRALFSILTYLAASKAVDFVVFGFDLLGVLIISGKHDKIKTDIQTKLNIGTTILKGEGGRSRSGQDIIYCVCSKLELPRIKALVSEHDEQAFVTVHKLTDTQGGTYRNVFGHVARLHSK